MGYQEKLFQLRQTGMKYSLEPMLRLAESLGHPENGLSFVHIAGTNGKGSVAALCEAIGRAAGRKMGLYSSPHLVSYRERFRVNGEMISEETLDRYLGLFEGRGWPGTFFEISTALALLWFRDQKVGLAAWETGLGGRLDATNIVRPLVSVVTDISLDHTQMLGDTISQIAVEKAGIIKPGVPVVASCRDPDALSVVRAAAADRGCELRIVGAEDLDAFEAPLAGEHQRWNTAAAVAAMRIALPGLRDEDIRRGLGEVRWPARCQWLSVDPPILLDGAHNPAAMEALVSTLPHFFGEKPFNLIFGAARDKDLPAVSARLLGARGLGRTVLVPLPHERSASPAELSGYFPGAEAAASFPEAWDRIRGDRLPVLVTGSLFLAGEVLRHFGEPGVRPDAGEMWGDEIQKLEARR